MELRVCVLGELTLEVDGDAIAAPSGRRPQALLAWLALNPGLHARSEVAARFWPDVLDESARASLRVALSAVRAALGPAAERLTATRDRVGLDAAWVDALVFAALCDEDRIDEALELRRGELLVGVDDDWAYAARDAFAARLSAALAGAVERAGSPERALALARERVAADPLSEAAHRDVIRLLAETGDRGAALLHYNRAAQRLRETLRVAPSAETRALVDSIRAGDAHAARPFVAPALVGRRSRSEFVGRGDALARLRAAWARASAGEPRLVLVAGEPGIGKTRLLTELGRGVADGGGVVLFGRCTEETLIPYQPFVEALDAYAAAGDLAPLAVEAGPAAAELARLVPRLAPALPGAAAVGDDLGGARYRLFEAVAAVLRAAAERHPVLVVLDDLHWSDRPTLLLLAHLARLPAPAPVLLAGAYRETELARTHPLAHALADLRRDGLVDRVALKGLTRDGVASLLREQLSPEEGDRLASAVARETGGNPFFVEEVASHLAQKRGQTPILHDIPEGVKEVVGRRLDRLAPGADGVLRSASLVGPRFDLRLLAAIGAGSEDDLLDALDEAVGAGLVRETPDEPGRYEFAHAIIRDTLYEELSQARRVRLHGAVADALEELPGEHLAAIAHHRLQAARGGDALRAVDAAVAAAEHATAQLAWEDAASQYERALDALELAEPDDGRRAELLAGLGDARMRSGERAGGRAAFGEAASIAARRGDDEALALSALGYGGVGVQVFEADADTADILERALAARQGAGDPLRARLLARLAIERYYDPGARAALSGEAVETARRSGDEGALLAALNARHVALWDPDHLAERIAIADELIAVASRTGDREAELQGRNWRVADLGERGDAAAFDAEALRHAALADELRLPGFRWYAPGWRALRAICNGRFDEYAALTAEVGTIGAAAQDATAALLVRLSTALPDLIAGRFDVLDTSVMTSRLESADVALAWRSSLAWFAAERGDRHEAEAQLAHFSGGIDRIALDANLVATLAELAETCALLGDVERGAQVYARLERWPDHHTTTMRALGSWGHVSHHLGRLAELLGRPDEALARYDVAIAGNERADMGVWRVRSQLHRAALLAELGDPAARERGSEALATAGRLGLDGLVARWGPRLASHVA